MVQPRNDLLPHNLMRERHGGALDEETDEVAGDPDGDNHLPEALDCRDKRRTAKEAGGKPAHDQGHDDAEYRVDHKISRLFSLFSLSGLSGLFSLRGGKVLKRAKDDERRNHKGQDIGNRHGIQNAVEAEEHREKQRESHAEQDLPDQ